MTKKPTAKTFSGYLIKSTGLLLLLTGLNKITGLIKLVLMTNQFGTGADADTFQAANQLPELFFSLLSGGAIAMALIPVYLAYIADDETHNAQKLFNSVFTLMFLMLGALCILAAIFSEPVTRFIAPDFALEQQTLMASLMRVILINILVLGMGSVLSNILHAHKHIVAPAIAAVLLDLGYCFGIWALAPRIGIHGVAWGGVIGSTAFLLMHVPELRRRGIGYWPQIDFKLAGLREVGLLMLPRMVTLGIVQAVDLIFIRLASGLSEGGISGFSFAYLIMVGMPYSFITITLQIVFFPLMAEQFNMEKMANLKRTMGQLLIMTWALVIPAVVGLIALGESAVSALLERGEFDGDSTRLVYSLIVILGLHFFGQTTTDMIALRFFSRHNTLFPMLANLIWAVVYVGLMYVLVPRFDIQGLTWASSLAMLSSAVAIYAFSRWRIDALEESYLLGWMGRILCASLIMAGVMIALRGIGLGNVAYLALAIPVGSVIYLGLFWLFGGRGFLNEISTVGQTTS